MVGKRRQRAPAKVADGAHFCVRQFCSLGRVKGKNKARQEHPAGFDFRSPEAPDLSGSGHRLNAGRQARNLAGGRVLVGDALGHGAHDLRLGSLQRFSSSRFVARSNSFFDLADIGAHARAAISDFLVDDLQLGSAPWRGAALEGR